MRKLRYLNGYKVVYKPDHPSAMTSANWDGWIYEHILVAEKMLGRPLRKSEEVHHLNGRKSDNRKKNLLVLLSSMHAKLEQYLRKLHEHSHTSDEAYECKVCRKPLNASGEYCSNKCRGRDRRLVERPSKKRLKKLMRRKSWLEIGRMFGVSDNAVRKWAKAYGLEWTPNPNRGRPRQKKPK